MVGGGSERDCLHLCNGWVAQGHSVQLLIVRAVGPLLERLDPRVRVFAAGASRVLRALLPFWRELRRQPAIPTLVFDFDLAVGFGMLQWTRPWRRLPIIYRESSSPRQNIPRASHWMYRAFIARHRAVIAQSEDARSQLLGLGLGHLPTTIIPNPCFAPKEAPPRLTRTPDAPFRVMAVGRLTPEKGFDRLIRGFQRLLARSPGAQLAILGEGPQRGALEQLVKELGLDRQVSLPGFQHDVGAWHARADVFVLASHYEGQSNALVEAVTACCPSVCAACEGGQKEFMRRCGLERWLVPTERFEASWADYALGATREPPELWQEARRRILAWADPNRVRQAYLDFCLHPEAAPQTEDRTHA
jgi:glycosyltransferase involved in cell wall biosynthesis